MDEQLSSGNNVLFGSEVLHARSPANMNTWLIKKREDELLEAFYAYNKAPDHQAGKGVARLVIIARIKVFWRMIKPDYIKRHKEDRLACDKLGWNPSDAELEAIIDIIEEYLWNEIKINAIATRKDYDMTNLELDNAEKGL